MDIQIAGPEDFDAWIALAREVEPLFGPMADVESFREALRQAISNKTAFCLITNAGENRRIMHGGIIISKESNEIVWLAVSAESRGKGLGKALLQQAIDRLNQEKSIVVQTFDESVPEGKSARMLYKKFGFVDYKKGEINPAGIPTIIMQRPVSTDAGFQPGDE